MEKVGIITINDYNNYGNRLQNYALQEAIKKLKFDAITIVNNPSISIKDRLKHDKIKGFFYILLKAPQVLKTLLSKKPERKLIDIKKEKIRNLKSFSNQYIHESSFIIDRYNIPKDFEKNYIAFVVGSDQIWNPHFRMNTVIDFLTFAPQHKRIAFSPSFGVSEIPRKYEKTLRDCIRGMNFVSVREEAGAEIIKKITGKNVQVLIDPTLMLDETEWLKIIREPSKKPHYKFLCTYFLGSTFEIHKEIIYNLAKENDLEVINLGSLHDLEKYSIGPSEFLYYIASSELFLTDSYHGTIFSIIFKKPFVVFDRLGKLPTMNSRLDTLLSKFNLTDRKWETVQITKNYQNLDFSGIGHILENEKSKAYDYLKKSLSTKGIN